MRILVTDGMDKTALETLRAKGHEVVEQFYAPEELGEAIRDFDVVVVRSATKVRANHIDAAKGSRLKLIIRGGVGVDNIDVAYAEANGIAVKNTPRASSNSVAELALAHMLSCARFVSIAGHTMREGKWEKKAYGKGVELGGKTLGVIGYGRIGQALGRMAQGLGMNVVAYDIYHVEGIECETMHYVTMDELLAQYDSQTLQSDYAQYRFVRTAPQGTRAVFYVTVERNTGFVLPQYEWEEEPAELTQEDAADLNGVLKDILLYQGASESDIRQETDRWQRYKVMKEYWDSVC